MASGNLYNSPFEAQFDPDRAQLFIITKLIQGVHTCDLVQVLAVQPVSGKVGFVTVQPLVLDTDTGSVVLAQTPIYNVPYMRYQGGSSAVILDPVADDIGLAIFAESDITNVKQTLAAGAPATARTHSTADALYIGGVLNPDPTQYVKFQPGGAGIDIVSPGEVTLQAGSAVTITSGTTTTVNAPSGFIVNANMTLNGTMSGTRTGAGAYQFAGTLVAPDAVINGVTQSTHEHGGVTTGGGNTTGPHN
ncbi:MAG: hypothetical protein P4L92_18795 [Rudaea sp.]|nr:hypothetical protein [Rudaea sp.]